MADDEEVENPGEMIRFIRWIKRWSQPKLSRKTGIAQSRLSLYEAGEEKPGPAQRQRIARAGGVPLRVWGFIGYCLQLIRKAIASGAALSAPRAEASDGREETRAAVWQAVDRALDLGRAELALLRSSRPAGKPNPPAEAEIRRADSLVETLRSRPEARRRLLIEGAPSFRNWVVCLRLCVASERAAADDPAKALELAELAVFIADRVPGTDAWRLRLKGYCMGWLANAQKTRNEFQLADTAFSRAWRDWKAGEDERGLLAESRLFDLEASFRAAERKFGEALRLHDKALAGARPEERGHFLLNKSVTLGEKGDNEGSIEVLKEAATVVDERRQPRLYFGVRFNLAANLLRLHRAAEAAPIVKEVRKLVERLGDNALDLVRTRWLEGNLHAGLGQREEAIAVLQEVRRALEKLPFDHALASLDLALVYRAEGRVAEVQELAVEMLAVFEAMNVHREAIAALMLFRDAAARGVVPVTALLLGPVSRQRFAQNERSVFGFLSSVEPHGFVEFLKSHQADTLAWYGPDRLWDYLVANFGMALATGADSARFSLAFEAIDRAAAKGGPLHVALTKCAAVIEPFRNGSGLAVAREFLEAALPEAAAPAVASAIADLVEWAVLMRQPRLGGYALFAGSDFDLEQAVEEVRGTVDAKELAALPHRVGLGFVVAKRHYFRTGALRAFEIVVYIVRPDDKPKALAAELRQRQPKGAGLMVHLLADDSLPPPDIRKYGAALAKELDELGVVAAVAASLSGSRLRDEAAELFALEKVAKEHPQLQGDRIARREIAARHSALLDAIQRDLTEALDDATWWVGPNGGEATRDSLSVIATALADAGYYQTPILKSELVQRERPSSNAMAAVRDLGHAMVEAEAKLNLGFTGYPPEMGLYLTVLRPFGLHRENEPGVFGFLEPDDGEAGRSLRPVWNVLEEASEVTLDHIYAAWAKPPLGLKAGVMPIFALANILARRERLAVYVDDVFQTAIDSLFVDRLLQNPKAIRLKRVDRTAHEAGVLSGLALRLGVPGEPAALPVAQALFQRFQSLPVFAQRTERLADRAKSVRGTVLKANDPEALLFHALPALELGDDPAAAVVDSLIEAEKAYPALLADLRRTLARVLGADPATFDGVATRAKTIAGLTNDLRFEAFVMRAATFEGGEGEIEGLASLLAQKPPRNWSDRDRDQALLDLARFGRRFREIEVLAAVRERSSTAEALALVVGLDPETLPLLTSFELTESEKNEASRLAKRILDTLGRKKTERNVRLAALARVVVSLSSETEREAT